MIPSPTAHERVRTLTTARPGRCEQREQLPDRTTPNRLGTRNGWAMRTAYLGSDLMAVTLAFVAAELCLRASLRTWLSGLSVVDCKLYGLLAIGLIVAAAGARTYAAIPPRPARQFRGWVLGAAGACVAILLVAGLLGAGSPARYAGMALATLLAIPFASFGRAVCRIALGSMRWWGTPLIVVGSGGLAAKAFADLDREPQWGLRPVGFVDDAPADDAADNADSFAGPLERLDELAAEFRVDRALVAANSFDADELAELLSRRSSQIRHWIVLPPLRCFPSLWLEDCEAARMPALAVTNRLLLPWSWTMKRALDLVITVGIGMVALPLVAVLAVVVRLTSPGPVFYGQERVGRHGRRFTAWKFRTMYRDADTVLSAYLEEHPELAAQWQAKHKLLHDPRITWAGRWLRVTSLDELPQVWNVFKGDMSLVGPRPIVAAEIEKYADRYEHYIKVLPGITGLWQVSGRNNTTYDERVDLDAYYAQNWSLWLDLYILACTVKVVLLREGAY